MNKKQINDITIFYKEEKYLKILDQLEELDIEKVFHPQIQIAILYFFDHP